MDTASDGVAVVYEEPGEAARVEVDPRPREHSASLLRLVEKVCAGRLDRVEAIVIIRGPGAYAGIRVGLATAQGLSLATGIAVFGIDTLRAVAEAAWAQGGRRAIAAIHPAGRGDFAIQHFGADGSAGEAGLSRPPFESVEPAGEGAGAMGGLEIGAVERVLGAIAAYRGGATTSAEALYVREPHITLPRTNVTPAPGAPGSSV